MLTNRDSTSFVFELKELTDAASIEVCFFVKLLYKNFQTTNMALLVRF